MPRGRAEDIKQDGARRLRLELRRGKHPQLEKNQTQRMNAQVRSQVLSAVQACEEKKGEEISILEMDQQSSAFTDYFVICSGKNPRQIQAIADEVTLRLKKSGNPANQVEGYNQGDWVLIDFVDFVVHIFAEATRKFYDLERLWKSARRVTVEDLKKPVARVKKARSAPAASRSGAKKKSRTKATVRRVRKAK
jgi:iojap-like ribosome-associated protein